MKIRGKPEDPFFEFNDDLRYIPDFAALIAEYGEEKAGKLLWAIYLIYHPRSDLFEAKLTDKQEWVQETYLQGEVVDWAAGLIDDVLRVFPLVTMEYEERMYYDGVMLYEEAVRDARTLMPKDKVAFMKSLGSAASEINRLKSQFVTKTEKEERAAGDVQSGYLSRIRKS